MFEKKDKQEEVNRQVGKLNRQIEPKELTATSIDENIALIKELFKDDDVLRLRPIQSSINPALRYCVVYFDGMIDNPSITQDIIRPLLQMQNITPGPNLIDDVMNQFVLVNSAEKTKEVEKLVESVTYGDTLLLVDGSAEALILNSKGFATRSVAEPENEKILLGPREGFAEAVMPNLSLIRRKLRTNDLKMRFHTVGERSKTQICICYLDSLVNKQIVDELYKRLDKIHIDGILDSNYLTEQIRDSSFSCFRTTGYTERPDIVAGKLLEGRIAILVDGSPVALTIPYLFIENFQSNEDYYLNYYYTSFSRMLRIIAFFITITVPAFFIAIAAYHPEMLPPSLMVNFANARGMVPLSDALEIIVMLLVFDLLRETGVRMPSNLGQAMSIVGALVIGQAAVEARLVAAPTIIVVAVTGITSLILPKLDAAILMVRAAFIILAALMGLPGLIIGFAFLLTHILNLYSFGVPQLTPVNSLRYQDMKDIIIRAPWPQMLNRPGALNHNRIRMRSEESGDAN